MRLGGRAAAVAATMFLGGAAGAAVWWGCSVYDTSLLLPRPDAAGGDDGPAGDDGGGPDTGPNPCPLSKAPPRPAADDPSNGDVPVVVVAMHTLDIGLRDDGGPAPPFGFDVDGIYTCCADAGDSCKSPVHAMAHCDEEGGRDDSAGELLRNFALVANGALTQDTIEQRLGSGVYSVLFAVSRYNGQPNDTSVVLAVYASTGVVPAPDGGAQTANWDGNDVWGVSQLFAVGPNDAGPPIPVHFDPNAYVAGGTLVTGVDVPIIIGSSKGDIALTLTGNILTAKLVPANGTFRMDQGRAAGRLKTSDMLAAAHAVGNPFGSGYICPGSAAYATLKMFICQGSDVVTDPTMDNTGATCDGLSMAVGFTADPAIAGPIEMGSTRTNGCPEAGPDDCP